MQHRLDRRPRLAALLLLVALVSGMAATRLGRPARCPAAARGHADPPPDAGRLGPLAARPQVPAVGHVPPDGPALDVGSGVEHRARGPPLVVADLRAMAAAARSAGARLAVQSAFRSYLTQRSTFSYWVRVDGYTQAIKGSARAGHSEHQLGTTIDFRSFGGSAPWYHADWGTTRPALAQGERLAVWLRDVLPEGQVECHLLPVRALALPLCRPSAGGADPRQRPDPARVPVAGAEPPDADPDRDPGAERHAERGTDAERDTRADPAPTATSTPIESPSAAPTHVPVARRDARSDAHRDHVAERLNETRPAAGSGSAIFDRGLPNPPFEVGYGLAGVSRLDTPRPVSARRRSFTGPPERSPSATNPIRGRVLPCHGGMLIQFENPTIDQLDEASSDAAVELDPDRRRRAGDRYRSGARRRRGGCR